MPEVKTHPQPNGDQKNVTIDQSYKSGEYRGALISDLISALQLMKETHGDIPVLVWQEQHNPAMGESPKTIVDWTDGRCLIE